jgi:hypothetical protein
MHIPNPKIDMEDDSVEHKRMNAIDLNSILLIMLILTALVPSQHICVCFMRSNLSLLIDLYIC